MLSQHYVLGCEQFPSQPYIPTADFATAVCQTNWGITHVLRPAQVLITMQKGAALNVGANEIVRSGGNNTIVYFTCIFGGAEAAADARALARRVSARPPPPHPPAIPPLLSPEASSLWQHHPTTQ